MKSQAERAFINGILVLFIFARPVDAGGHHQLNGTWTLVPTRSDIAGQPVIQTGTLTIWDRQHHIYVSRTFTFDGAAGTVSYNFSVDGDENSMVREGKTVKCKAKWEGDVLRVTTTEDKLTTVERYQVEPDGSLRLSVERPDNGMIALAFVRQ